MPAVPDIVKSEPTCDHVVPLAPASLLHDDEEAHIAAAAAAATFAEDDDDGGDDPVVRTIDVHISPALSRSLRLLQFPLQPSVSSVVKAGGRRDRDAPGTPAEARFRPKNDMLELDYTIPSSAQAGQRQLPDKMCLSQRTYFSTSVVPSTHMALARLNFSGTRMDVVPMQRSVMQMRPSFRHLHDGEDDDGQPPANSQDEGASRRGKIRPIMFQKRETERSIAARRSSYAYKRAQEEAEDWVELEVHGFSGNWSNTRKEAMAKVKCPDQENELRLAGNTTSVGDDGAYIKSLNYLDSFALARSSGEGHVEDLSGWAPSTSAGAVSDEGGAAGGSAHGEATAADDADGALAAPQEAGAAERAAAELASKLAVLLQTGLGTMVPYSVLRSRFGTDRVPDETLVAALSSCAVLVRGNFALKSKLARFISSSLMGGKYLRRNLIAELRDFVLLLLNMHGMIQRERLVRAYAARARGGGGGYESVGADTITFVLETVSKPAKRCWVAKVDDDEGFAASFPEVAACYGVYWMKKKEKMIELVRLYEDAEDEEVVN